MQLRLHPWVWCSPTPGGPPPPVVPNIVYRVVECDGVVPMHGDSVLLQEPGRWSEVNRRSFRPDGLLVVSLEPPWPRDVPLPEGWTATPPWALEHEPYQPSARPGRIELDKEHST